MTKRGIYIVMETRIVTPDEKNIRAAGKLIREGDLVAFPTETVYGLGADALNAGAVNQIFIAKGRPQDNPLIVHISDMQMLRGLCEMNANAEKLAAAFWPGPLTMLLPKTCAVPDVTTAGLDTVGIRMPDHAAALALIAAAGTPIAAPSANLSGRPSPTSAAHVFEDMNGRIPLIIDGGACRVGVESTVLDVSGAEPVIFRPGAITQEMVAAVCGGCSVADSVMRPLKEGERAPSPGMKHRHYAPKGRMTVFIGEKENVCRAVLREYPLEANTCVLCHEDHLSLYKGMNAKSIGKDARESARLLFALLRDMDEEGYDRILCEGWAVKGEALAVMNRMARAAAFDLREV